MSAEHPTPPLKHVLGTAREYLTHWAVAGFIVTLTGFTPDHWIAHLLHYVKLPGDFRHTFLSSIDFRLLAVGAGVALITGDVLLRNRRERKTPVATPAIQNIAGTDDIHDKPSIAVLPFVNMSDDKSQEYFADGMTEDIITGLSYDSRLFVIARNSTFAYKGQSPDIRAVGKELGVRYVLEGSIRPINDRLRISVQLIETSGGSHVWADKIDRPAAEIFAVMDDVVDGLVMALCSSLGVAESQRAKRHRPEDLQAWALCVQAEVLYVTQADLKSSLEAEKLARRAADIEPGYAISWALLACMIGRRIVLGLSRDLAKDRDLVKDSAEIASLVNKALMLAPNDPTVLAYSGYATVWAGQAAQAIEYLDRSLAINPNNSFAQFARGGALWVNGRSEEGLAQLNNFLRHSPKDPYIGFAHFYRGCCYLSLDDPQQAEQSTRQAIINSPTFAWAYVVLAMSLAALGRDAEAHEKTVKFRQLEPSFTREFIEEFWRHVMREEAAEKWLALLHQAWKD